MDRYVLEDAPEVLAEELAARLRAGEVGILPTETVHGLVAAAESAEGCARLIAIKGREPGKKCQVLISDLSALPHLRIPQTPLLEALANAFWPGPLTLVMVDKNGDTQGLRIPDHPFTLAVLRALNAAILATSANPAGGSPAESLSKGFSDLLEEPDFVVQGAVGEGHASTVARLRDEQFEILRPGPISLAALNAIRDQTCLTKSAPTPLSSSAPLR
ncbi:MAG: L-threonylcarbamoyladenylate synthase [Rhodothermales bacterium]|jgi:L-threonylcarbamoyladenylate synthase